VPVPQLHVDLETLDTEASARILSIGAVLDDAEFYLELDQSLYSEKFTKSQRTEAWWAQQGGFAPTTDELVSPGAAIAKLIQFVDRQTLYLDEWEVWANSPSFDCSILRYHMHEFAMRCPWQFWQERDVRTIKNMARQLRLNVREVSNPHNALRDAKNQQALVASVYDTLIAHLHRSAQNPTSWAASVSEVLKQGS
jgi:hypothetical protein